MKLPPLIMVSLLSLIVLLGHPTLTLAQEFQLQYCYGDQCGLPGGSAPVTAVPPSLRGADTAGRRYGPEAQQFVSAVQQEQANLEQLKQTMAALKGTPYALDATEINRRVIDYFGNSNLLQDLKSAYSAPLPVPANVPSSLQSGFDQLWTGVEEANPTSLVRSATIVRSLQRQAQALSDSGVNPAAASWASGELRRNFVDANGLIRFLGNHEVFADLGSLDTPQPRLTSQIVDGINRLVVADYVLRQHYAGQLPPDSAAEIGAIASGYRTASAIAARDLNTATAIVQALDASTRVIDAFLAGFIQEGAATLDGLATFIKSPISTTVAIATAIENWDVTANAIKTAVSAKAQTFLNGNAEVRSGILGEISFQVATTFLGAGAAKYGSEAVAFVANSSAATAVTRGMAVAIRPLTVGGGLSAEIEAGLSFVENTRPSAALSLYTSSPKVAGRVGEQINAFVQSGVNSTLRQSGGEFLLQNPGVLDSFVPQVAEVFTKLDGGQTIKVYLAVEKRFLEGPSGLLQNGLKGSDYSDWYRVAEQAQLDYRYGVGRYVASSAEASRAEMMSVFNPLRDAVVEADFVSVPNNGAGYRFYPSTKYPGSMNVFDKAPVNYGAFRNLRVLP